MMEGFWLHALSKNSYQTQAKKELIRFAQIEEKNNYSFNEYYHGQTIKPLGRKKQAWSAAGYIIGYNSVINNKTMFY